METTPDYNQSHLVVAAARVLAHKLEKPPTYEELGDLLGISHEVIGAVARALQARGIVKIRMTPFDTRVEVADHTALEELPRDERGAAMKEEVDAFLERSKEKQEEIEKLFGEEEYQKRKKEKQAGLEEQLKEFQKKKSIDPFAGPEDEDDGGEDEDDGDKDEKKDEKKEEDKEDSERS